jgi:hypothetical protein
VPPCGDILDPGAVGGMAGRLDNFALATLKNFYQTIDDPWVRCACKQYYLSKHESVKTDDRINANEMWF